MPSRRTTQSGRTRARRLVGALLAAGLAGLAAGPACRGQARERPRHVLLIVVDTLRADHVGAYGELPEPFAAGPSPTPAIDALARRGALFERAYAQSSWTAPSMVSLMTGRRVAGDRLSIPLPEGVSLNLPDDDPELSKRLRREAARIPTMATAFRAAGWSTAAFICNDIVSAENGYAHGFDVFEQHQPYIGFEAPIRAWFERHSHENTFTYVHLNEPHDPYRPPDGVRFPESFKELWQASPPGITVARRHFLEGQRVQLGLPPIDEDVTDIELESARYVDDVRFGDNRVGALLSGLEDAGMLEDTLIVLTADHGEGLWTRAAFASGSRGKIQLEDRRPPPPEPGQHAPVVPPSLFWSMKVTHGNQLYSELTRIPLIVSGPGFPADRRFDLAVENVDVWPTLLEACGLALPTRLDGRSLFELCESSSSWRQSKPLAFSATRYGVTVLDQDAWQLISPTALGTCLEGLTPELYNLRGDPSARTNVAAAHPELTERLRDEAAAMRLAALPENYSNEEIQQNGDELAGLGYFGGGIVDVAPEQFLERSTAELIATIRSATQLECLDAYYSAQALVERSEMLSANEREAIKAALTEERPAAVRETLQSLFE